ncbi:unnamed protein product [Diamesa hyperborea]
MSLEINLVLADDQVLKLDLFWLRDHCRCVACYDHANHQRKISILEIPDDIAASQFVLENEKLSVVWNDNHKSDYDLVFLLKNQLQNDQQAPPKMELCLWNASELSEKLKSSLIVPFNSYMNDPEPVLKNLYQYGVAFIDGVKPNEQNTEFVMRQLFPIQKTFFGEMWTFSDNKDHSDTAYTKDFLGPHNDGTYFNSASGLQILHCIQHSGTGGENLLIDGFYVCEKLKRENPDVFERLCKTIVPGEYIEDGRHHTYSAPIINVDPLTGQLIQIRYNLYDRAPFNTVAIRDIRQFYSDLKCLTREMEDPLNQHYYKLTPGTVMIFDNWRILHGRQKYTGKRTMTGCYVERTEFQSALRSNGIID